MRYVNSADNSVAFLRAAGDPLPVYCRGIAAHDSEPLVAYFLDGNRGEVLRVIPGAVFVPRHGPENGFFSFNDPAGARFDAAGNLYVTSTNSVYKIAPNEAATLVVGGFTAAAGLDIAEEAGTVTLLVTDQAAGELWLVDAGQGFKMKVASGFTGPTTAVFAEDAALGLRYVAVAEPTRIYRLPDPRMTFMQDGSQVILLSKPSGEDSYPNPHQSQDGKIPVTLRVNDAFDPTGRTVYFRLRDPWDPSRYIDTPVENDNLPSSPAGTLNPTQAVLSLAAIATTTLTVDPRYSGNNYQVEASFDPPGSFKTIARSAVYSSWKRAYIEYDRMYRAGEFITQDSGAGELIPQRISVANPGTFAVDDEVHLISASSPAHQEGEIVLVTAVGATYIDVLPTPTLTYFGTPNFPDDSFPHSFAGKVGSGIYEVAPTTVKLSIAFDDTFLDWVFVSEGAGRLPLWRNVSSSADPAQQSAEFQRRWSRFFQHAEAHGNPPTSWTVTPNHVMLAASSRYTEPETNLGATAALLTSADISMVSVESIEQIYGGGAEVESDRVTVHELAHQWNVNPPVLTTQGHDSFTSWDAPDACLMNTANYITGTGIARFHWETAPPRDLECIRQHVNDLSDDTCQ